MEAFWKRLAVHRVRRDTRGVRLQPADELDQSASDIVCGEFSPTPDQPALSMPALSAAPGVLLAAELVKEHIGGAPSLSSERNHLAASILAGPHTNWSTSRGKRPDCACTDRAYRDFYGRRWAVG